jgi:hypothetical protein
LYFQACAQHNGIPYIETSAKANTYVETLVTMSV